MKMVRRGGWIIVLLLAGGYAFGSPAGSPRAFLPASWYENPPTIFPVFLQSPNNNGKSVTAKENSEAVSDDRVEAIQTAIQDVHSPSLQALARALGLSSAQIGQKAFEDSEIGMRPISVINGNVVPEVAVKWKPPPPPRSVRVESEPALYLLSWDGKSWLASFLTPALDALTVRVLPATEEATPLFAVVLYRGMTAVPYPVIFWFRDHHASVAWDSRAPNSLYSGYDYGSIQFEKNKNMNVPVMIATGLADPGLLVFPPSSEHDGRGFRVAAAYVWRGNAYSPIRSEFTHNRDYTLYRFIAALHLHEYKTAYSFIDPKQFLKTNKPSLKLFREKILKDWPEFIDDQIFQVPSKPESKPGSHIFLLKLKHKKKYVYYPTFTSGPKYLLTGLKRIKTSE